MLMLLLSPVLVTVTLLFNIPDCVTATVLVLPDTVISAEVVPVAVLMCDTVLLSPVTLMTLV